jgi:hypothetical protein
VPELYGVNRMLLHTCVTHPFENQLWKKIDSLQKHFYSAIPTVIENGKPPLKPRKLDYEEELFGDDDDDD